MENQQQDAKCIAENGLFCFDSARYIPFPDELLFGACRNIDEFEKLNHIGAGTYGVVYRARDKSTDQIIAIKKTKISENGTTQIIALREINMLLGIHHENIVELRDVVVGKNLNDLYLVMEYCEQDMANLLDNIRYDFDEAQIKCMIMQVFKALKHLHEKFIIHRDVKMSNLLMTNQGTVKLGDFGLTRKFGEPEDPMTPGVVTLWYRAPELLLGSHIYTSTIDVWAAGCIFGELLQRKPLLPGRSEFDQLERIIELLGTPNETIWKGFDELPVVKIYKLRVQPYNNMKSTFKKLNEAGLSLLNQLFIYDPVKRTSASDALNSSYFSLPPLPCPKDLMPSFRQYRNTKK